MYLRDLADSLLRRWYFVAAGVVLALGLSFVAASAVSPTYRAESSVVLVPPKITTGATGNPYLFLGGLQQSVDVLARAMSADAAHETVADTAGTGHYDVVADVATSAPILLITANDTSSAGAQRLLDAAKAEVPIVFARLQSSLGVSARSQITTSVVTSDEKPKVINKTRYRTVALVASMSMLMVVVLVGFLDGVLLARALRRKREALDDLVADEVEPVDSDEIDEVEPDEEPPAVERELQAARPGLKKS